MAWIQFEYLPTKFCMLKFNPYCEVERRWKLNPTMVFRRGPFGQQEDHCQMVLTLPLHLQTHEPK